MTHGRNTMFEKIVPEPEISEVQQEALRSFFMRMPPYKADTLLGVSQGTTMAAIKRKEIKPLRCPGKDPDKSHVYVTPQMLAQWILNYW